MKKLPIGIYDFEKLISEDYYYIDKTLLVKELLDSGAEATLIPRPRRFGKTLNMTMLKCFFEETQKSKKYLFNDLKIAQYPDCMKHQGQYPVVYISLKDAKASHWEDCKNIIVRFIRELYLQYSYLLDSSLLTDLQKKLFSSILNGEADQIAYMLSLKTLCDYLFIFHKKKPIVLIDEYDSPIHAEFTHNYYDQVIEFMRGFLSAGLKDNQSLQFSVVTGILRVAKESIFSGLNNLRVCTLLDDHFSDKFGLLEGDVQQLLLDYHLDVSTQDVARWYDGYTVGKQKGIYNPWSIINLVDNRGELKPYWINTSDNAIIKDLFIQSSTGIKKEIEELLGGGVIEKFLREDLVFQELFSRETPVWNFLLLSGYLTCDKTYLNNDMRWGSLRLPNLEVKQFFRTVVLDWLEGSLSIDYYRQMLQALISGNVQEFSSFFEDIALTSLSTFDVTDNEPERFYHALVLGMLVSLNNSYEVLSNRESGYGRYDVTLTPRDKKNDNLYGIIIEFKRIKKHEKKTLETGAQEALDQIETMAYETQMRNVGVKNIIKLAIVFKGKKTLVKQG